MLNYSESLTREELTRFVRHYLVRSTRFIGTVAFLIITIALGGAAVFSDDQGLARIFVSFSTLIWVMFLWQVLAEFRAFKVYSQTQYPQKFEFTESAMAVTGANGIHYLIPWKHVRKIYPGRSYVHFATAIGPFWVHKDRFADHLPAVTALWRASLPHNRKRAD